MINAMNTVTTPQRQEAYLKNQQAVNFKSENAQKDGKPIDNAEQTVKDEGLSSTAKWAIGLGLTALASYGIYAMTKGKVKPKDNPIPTPGANNPVAEIKEMTIDAFKRGKEANIEGVNRLVNGQAILADGTKYTGNITSKGEDGSKVVMEYVDGVLQKSTKTAKDGTRIFEKAYTWAEDGLIKEVKKDGKTILDENELLKTYIMANSKLIKENPNSLVNANPKVIESLEEIYEDVFEVGNGDFIDAVNGDNGLLRTTLRQYGHDFNVYGSIVDNAKLKRGLVNLRKQNKELCKNFSEVIDTSLDKRFRGILELYQKLDNYLTDKSLKDDVAARNLKNKLSADLRRLGYVFANRAPVAGEMYDVLGHGAIGAPEVISRPILNFDGKCVSRGKVWLPNQ